MRRRLPRPFVVDANFQIQVLSSLLFRNQTAYVVGRVVNGAHDVSVRRARSSGAATSACMSTRC